MRRVRPLRAADALSAALLDSADQASGRVSGGAASAKGLPRLAAAAVQQAVNAGLFDALSRDLPGHFDRGDNGPPSYHGSPWKSH